MSSTVSRRTLLGAAPLAIASGVIPGAVAGDGIGTTDPTDTPILNLYRQREALEARWQALTDQEADEQETAIRAENERIRDGIMAEPVTCPLDLLAKMEAWDGEGDFDAFADVRALLAEVLG